MSRATKRVSCWWFSQTLLCYFQQKHLMTDCSRFRLYSFPCKCSLPSPLWSLRVLPNVAWSVLVAGFYVLNYSFWGAIFTIVSLVFQAYKWYEHLMCYQVHIFLSTASWMWRRISAFSFIAQDAHSNRITLSSKNLHNIQSLQKPNEHCTNIYTSYNLVNLLFVLYVCLLRRITLIGMASFASQILNGLKWGRSLPVTDDVWAVLVRFKGFTEGCGRPLQEIVLDLSMAQQKWSSEKSRERILMMLQKKPILGRGWPYRGLAFSMSSLSCIQAKEQLHHLFL